MEALTLPPTQDRWRLVEALQRTLEQTIQVTRDAERVLRAARLPDGAAPVE